MADDDTEDNAGAQTYPPSGCGTDLDPDLLWIAAKADFVNAQHPEKDKFGYVILDGGQAGPQGKYNLLLVPEARIKGIECDKILSTPPQSRALNVWKYGWDEAAKAFQTAGPDILLGINSLDGRTRDQLHIHLTALKRDLRPKLDALRPKIPSDLTKWNNSIFELGPSLNGKTYVYRIAHVENLTDHNPFDLLQEHVAAHYQDRFAQSLAVVAGTKGSGFYLLATQGQPTQTGQPLHKPDLSINGHYGTTTAEGLMDRDWKK